MKNCYYITDYGAEANGMVCTTAIQTAIDDCEKNGGGCVVVPSGTFVTGTIRLRSNIDLYLSKNAKLLASENLDDYNDFDEYTQNFYSEREGWSGKHLIICIEQENVSISGFGTIDGNSEFFMGEPKWADNYHWRFGCANRKDKSNLRPGQMICFVESKNIRVEGVTLCNSTAWTCLFHGCEEVFASRVKIYNKPWNENTDGFDVDSCKNVIISNCMVDCGDDPFTVRCNPQFLKNKDRICENIIITDCIASSETCGIRVGVGTGLIRNLKFTNNIIKRAGDAIQLACNYINDGCVNMENLTFSNIIAEKTAMPLCIYNTNGAYIKNVVFDNCLFEVQCGMFNGINEKAVLKEFTFRNCKFNVIDGFWDLGRYIEVPFKEDSKYILEFKNIQGLSLQNVKINLSENSRYEKLYTENCTLDNYYNL